MGREVRMVPQDWAHPKDEYTGEFKPLMDGYEEAKKEFLERIESHGLQDAIEWCGCPDETDYMPTWLDAERTHYMMYENTSEGTPLSPAFATPEELARWLTDTGASSFGSSTASYESWLRVAKGGYACSAIYTPQTGLVNGVDGFS